jgi:hypothetical protein
MQDFFKMFLLIRGKSVTLQSKKKSSMAYTKETLVVSNPSERLVKALEELRKNKLEQLERLRNMKPEEFSRRVILA